MLFRVRRANLNDISNVKLFYKEALPLINSEQTSWIPDIYPNVEDALEAILHEEFFICIDDQEKVVGSMILNQQADDEYKTVPWAYGTNKENHLIVHTLISHPKRLKNGIASKMISFIKQWAIENNMASIKLDTLANNVPARKLYEKNGFSYIGRRYLSSFDNKGTDDCVFYQFQLYKEK